MASPSRWLCEDSFTVARDEFESIVEFLRSGDASRLAHHDLETLLSERGLELMRRLFQAHLETRGPGEAAAPVRGADGVERDSARVHERELSTVFGNVDVRRVGYGAQGVDSLHPLDAELNLPEEQYSFGLRRLAALEAAKGSFDEAQEALASHTGAAVPKRQVEELVRRAAVDFHAFYDQRAAPPASPGEVLVITVDGKGVVMLPSSLREETRRKAAKKQHKLDRRLTKGEKRNAKRMATVAAVYTIAPFPRGPEDVVRVLAPGREAESRRPRPEAKRVWASVEKGPEEVIAEAFAEAERRDPARKKAWVALVDGNNTQLDILRREARKRRIDLTIVVDIIHVCEYLWSASLCFHTEAEPAREAWVEERLLRVLHGMAGQAAGGMRRSATKRGLTERKAVDDCADYLLAKARHLNYASYLARGLPIATGVIEGACRHLIKDRMDITGARWSLDGAEAVLRLRALRSSGDFDAYWEFHQRREYDRNHAARYADAKVVPVKGRHLKRVK